jgi:hypothetical protein
LKNIPAIRQKVAMFLRNICLQVITIHLFGFKVYESEKKQILFHKYFVGMNIIYIFVEIIKKSTTMKNTIFTLIVTLISLVVNSQVISVNVKGFQLYTRPNNETINESKNNNSVVYTKFQVIDAEYTFDLNNSKFYQKDNIDNSIWVGDITGVIYNNNIIDVSVGDATYKLISSKDNDSKSDVFIIEYNTLGHKEGFLSMYDDFIVVYK